MSEHDPADEIVFLDYKDDPDGFGGSKEYPFPPAGMSWWEGRWPTGGVNRIDDLKWWVELAWEEMISLNEIDSLADIGRMLGIQALKNADRYLGKFGKGDHPHRPSVDQLQRVEDVENALEDILRYLREQSQPSGSPSAPRLKGRRSQADADAAISAFIAKHANQLAPLREGAQADRREAIQAARLLVGRNAINRALGVSLGAVSNSEVYRQLSNEFHFERERPALNNSKAIGLDIAIEEKAMTEDDPVVEEAARREAAEILRSKLDEDDAELLIGQMECGTLSVEKALEYAQVMRDNRDDTKTRRKRR
ncbi:MAG: hypothetical protein C4296_02925 [Gemmataceae bacterium]